MMQSTWASLLWSSVICLFLISSSSGGHAFDHCVCSPVLEVMSGDVENFAEEAASVHVPPSQEGQPQHVKHEGFVFLQRPRSDPRRQGAFLGEHWLLLHSITHQKVKLPAPVDIWQLTIDNDGFATLYDAGTDTELDCCVLFKRHWVKQDGELHIMDPKCGIAKLAELQIRHKEVQLIVAVGPTRATHKISGCALGSPLPQGIRFLWSGICLYSVLCLKCQKRRTGTFRFRTTALARVAEVACSLGS